MLRTNILFSRKDDKLNSMAVVSAGAGEGKSTTVFNLASIFAQSGQRVIVVDSDLRRPTLHKMLHVTNGIGLTNYLLKQNSLEEVIQTTNNPSLDFLASGKLPSSSLGILSSAQMKDLISELKQRYDFVFFDSPPIMGVSDASILASEMDMTLQVIQYRRYPQPMNIRAKQLIEKVGGNLVGIVLNNINMSQDESYYYYSGYYHDYYYRSSTNEESDSPPASRRPPRTAKARRIGKTQAGYQTEVLMDWLIKKTGDMMRTSIHDGLRHWGIGCGLLAVGWLAAGCHTSAPASPPTQGRGAPPPTGPRAGPAGTLKTSDLLRVGDFINVTFLDLPETLPAMDATIKQDGTITLPLLNHPVQAAGKTTGELEKDIWQFYVPGGYYKRLTVIVKLQGQFYSVKGEVKSPNRYPFATAMTVLKAITSAGDFTEFARKRTVKVFRFNGRIEIEDCIKALKDPRLDLPVYSGDLINVERRKTPFQR